MGTGPVTGASDRPSPSPLENRKADIQSPFERRQLRRNVLAVNRAALARLHDAELALLVASQRAARSAALQSLDAALASRHGAAIALVVARYADRRAAAWQRDPAVAADTLQRIADDEVSELARLTMEQAAQKRSLRNATVLSLLATQRNDRRSLRTRNRRQRIVAAIASRPPRTHEATRLPSTRKRVRRFHRPGARHFDRLT